MTVAPQSGTTLSRGAGSGNLYDILELILDRGLVIDVFVRVSLVGIEILKVDVRIVAASVDTYLRFAEACNRLDLESGRKAPTQLTDIVGEVTEGGAKGKSKGALTGAVETAADSLHLGRGEEDEEEEKEKEKEPRPRERPEHRERAPHRPTRRREE